MKRLLGASIVVEDALQICWQRAVKCQLAAEAWVSEAQLTGVQKLSLEFDRTKCRPIGGVADDGVTDMLAMHTNLVRTPGFERALK